MRTSEPEPVRPKPAVSDLGPARIRSNDLLHGRTEIVIQHGAEEYRLRLTSNGKLILTK